jgi:hypothetical protein
MTCYKGLPQVTVVLLALVCDAEYASLSGHSVRKIAVLILEWCYKTTGDREQYL